MSRWLWGWFDGRRYRPLEGPPSRLRTLLTGTGLGARTGLVFALGYTIVVIGLLLGLDLVEELSSGNLVESLLSVLFLIPALLTYSLGLAALWGLLPATILGAVGGALLAVAHLLTGGRMTERGATVAGGAAGLLSAALLYLWLTRMVGWGSGRSLLEWLFLLVTPLLLTLLGSIVVSRMLRWITAPAPPVKPKPAWQR